MNTKEIKTKIHKNAEQRAKMLTDEAATQIHLRPLALFGAAFLVGVIVARTWRR